LFLYVALAGAALLFFFLTDDCIGALLDVTGDQAIFLLFAELVGGQVDGNSRTSTVGSWPLTSRGEENGLFVLLFK
jgi:hypothetical protein